jgi:4-amino-4-deoxy-L-arabinose transferase-like glycosyltransferase
MHSSARGASLPRAFWVLLAVAAALRFGYVILWPQMPLCPDCEMYDEVGRNVAEGRGFVGGFAADRWDRPVRKTPDAPEIGVGPIYPGFLAMVYRAAGQRPAAVRVAQAAISTLTLFPLFSLTRRTLGERAAIGATALAAFYPAFIVYSGFVLTETLSTALLVAAFAAVARAWSSRSVAAWIAAGVVTGAAILLRAELLPVCAPIALLALWRRPSMRTLGALAAYALAVAVTMAPWVARNWVTFHRFIPVSAHDGDTLWISTKGWQEWHMGDPELQALAQGRDYIAQEDAMRDAAVREIRTRPLQFLATRVKQFPGFWFSSHTGNVHGLTESFGAYRARGAIVPLGTKVGLLVLNTMLIAAGLFAMFRALVRNPTPDVALMALPIVMLSGIHLILFATARYQVPMMPFVLAFAATLMPAASGTRAR